MLYFQRIFLFLWALVSSRSIQMESFCNLTPSPPQSRDGNSKMHHDQVKSSRDPTGGGGRAKKQEMTMHFLFLKWCGIVLKILENSTATVIDIRTSLSKR